MVRFLILVLCLTLSASASIIKKPPAKPVELTYAELACNEDDRKIIYEIITTVAENGKVHLALFKQGHLKEIGGEIQHVHPLKFLSTIFCDPHLKMCMPAVWADYFKWNHFLDGLCPSLTREAEKGKLHQYIKEFADEIQVPHESIQGFFDTRNWEGLVHHLIHHSAL